jgi:hypothetical protein
MQQPAQQQPAQQQPAQQQAPTFDLEKTIQMLSQQQSQPQVPQFPPMPISQAPGQGTLDLQQILGMMSTFFPQSTMTNFAEFHNSTNPQQQQQQQQQQSEGYEDPERKRMRQSTTYDDESQDQWSRQKRSKNGPMPHPKAGSVVCRFWADGKCKKGANCTFRHEDR